MQPSFNTKSHIRNFYPVIIASGAFFLSYYTRLMWSILSVYMPFKPTITQDGYVFALYFLGYVALQIPAGFVADRYDCGKIISISLLSLAVTTFLSGIATNIYQEYIISLLMGFSAAWIYSASLKIIDYYYKDNRAIFMGYYSIAWPLAIVLSGLILPMLAITVDYHWGYYSAAIGCIVFGIFAFNLKSSKAFNKKIDFSIIKNKNVLLISFGGFLFFLSYWSVTLYAYKYFIGIGVNHIMAGVMFSSMAIAGFISSPVSGFIAKKAGAKFTMIGAFVGYAFFTFLLAFVKIEIILLIIAFGMGFMRFIVTPLNNDLIMRIGKNNAGAATGIANVFWMGSGIVGSLLSPFLINNFGFKIFWVVLCVVILLAIAFYTNISLTK